MKKHLYLFSGLGADKRVFQFIDFSNYQITHIKWLVPLKKETIEEYASRLCEQITCSNPILIGLSFGGMLAIEVAKQINTTKVILISSAKSKNEIPFYFRFAGKLKLHKLIPIYLLKKSNWLTFWFFGVHTTFEKKLLVQIIKDTDVTFLKWAIDKIVCWKNTKKIEHTFHIHGLKDKLLPVTYMKNTERITGGGHLMILNKANEISVLLNEALN